MLGRGAGGDSGCREYACSEMQRDESSTLSLPLRPLQRSVSVTEHTVRLCNDRIPIAETCHAIRRRLLVAM